MWFPVYVEDPNKRTMYDPVYDWKFWNSGSKQNYPLVCGCLSEDLCIHFQWPKSTRGMVADRGMDGIRALRGFGVPGAQQRGGVNSGVGMSREVVQAGLGISLSGEMQQRAGMGMEGIQAASGKGRAAEGQNRRSADSRMEVSDESPQASGGDSLLAVENQSSAANGALGMQLSETTPPAREEDQALAKTALEVMGTLERPAVPRKDDLATFKRAVESAQASSFSLHLGDKGFLKRPSPPKEDDRASFKRAVESAQASSSFQLHLEDKQVTAEKHVETVE
jgi:hypothetical protein